MEILQQDRMQMMIDQVHEDVMIVMFMRGVITTREDYEELGIKSRVEMALNVQRAVKSPLEEEVANMID